MSSSRNAGKNRFTVIMLLTILALGVLAPISPLHFARQSYAASSIVTSGSVGPCNSSFYCRTTLSVTAGDVLVVSVQDIGTPTITPSDSLGSTFTLAASEASTLTANIYFAPLTSSGSDTITVTLGGSIACYFVVYEVSGVTTTGYATATGTGPVCGSIGSCTDNYATTSSPSYSAGSFLVASIIDGDATVSGTFTAGASFTAFIPSLSPVANTESQVASASSSTNFPASYVANLGTGTVWVEAGLVLEPLAATTTAVSCSPSSVAVSSSSICTVTVSGGNGLFSGETITWSQSGTGSVSLSSNTCTLSTTQCTVDVTGSSTGSVTIKASYPGDSNNLASAGTSALSVTTPTYHYDGPPKIPPGDTPGILNLTTYGGNAIHAYFVGMIGTGEAIYNIPSINETQLNNELAHGNFSLFPEAVSACSLRVGGETVIQVSGFSEMWWGGSLANSTEFVFGYYESFYTSAQGWPAVPAC